MEPGEAEGRVRKRNNVPEGETYGLEILLFSLSTFLSRNELYTPEFGIVSAQTTE